MFKVGRCVWDLRNVAVCLQKYDYLYKVNTETSHYLLSKVYRAKERIDQESPQEAMEWKAKVEKNEHEKPK